MLRPVGTRLPQPKGRAIRRDWRYPYYPQSALYRHPLQRRHQTSDVLPELQIIDVEQFEQAQKIAESRAKPRHKGNSEIPLSTKGQPLLVGNVYCGRCGHHLTEGQAMLFIVLPPAPAFLMMKPDSMDSRRFISLGCSKKKAYLTKRKGLRP